MASSSQNFRDHIPKDFGPSSVKARAKNKSRNEDLNNKLLRLNKLVAKNLQRFFSEPGALYTNANALSVATKGTDGFVSSQTVRNLLLPENRAMAVKRIDGFPRIDTLLKVLHPLGKDMHELFLPDARPPVKTKTMSGGSRKTRPPVYGEFPQSGPIKRRTPRR